MRFPFVAFGLVLLLALLLLANYQREVETRQRFIERTQESAIESRLNSYQRLLEVLFENIFDRPELAATLARAREGDVESQAQLRGRLYRDYYPAYANLTRNDFRELQFVLADGRSFLRFNRPDLYDDPITEQRSLLKRVLKGEVGRGVLENGRVYPGFRFAFPLRHYSEVVGAVDFCLSFEALQEGLDRLEEEAAVFSRFLVRKDLFEAVSHPSSRTQFKGAEINDKFLVERGADQRMVRTDALQMLQSQLRQDERIQQMMNQGGYINEVFCRGLGDCRAVILRPVYDSLNRPAAYIFTTLPMPDVEHLRRTHLGAFLVGAVMLLMVAVAIRRWFDSTRRLRTISDHMAEGMYVMDEFGRIVYVNPTACEILSYDEAALIGVEAHGLLHEHPEASECVASECPVRRHTLAGEIFRSSQERFRCSDGKIIRVSVVASPLWSHKRLSGSVVLFKDITEEHFYKARLQRSDVAFSSLAEAVMVTGPEGEIQAVNHAFTQITGYSEEEALGQTPRILKSGRHDQSFYEQLWSNIREDGHWEGEVWNRRKNGEIYPEQLRIAAVEQSNGELTGFVATFSDITEKLHQEQTLRKLAYHDPLTELHNRAAFLEMFEHALGHAQRRGRRLALLYLDLDRFKKINDTLGHVVGDRVLEESALRLRQALRSHDEVARLGGDEFIIMLEDFVDVETPARVARKVLSLLSQPIAIDHHVLHVTASIGIAVYPDDGNDVTALLKNADAAMYMAKREGRNGFHYFTQAMAQREEDRFALEIDLHTALLNDEFLLNYQPKICLNSGRITGLEALLRWQHPERGLLPPAEFLDVAHDAGVMRDITHWVITEACRQLQEWLDAGLDPGRIAINIDSHTFNSADAYDQIGRTVELSGISPHRVELEIPESGLLEKSFDDEFWKQLVDMGFEFSIDDFGKGESSLMRLKYLPVTTLKVDKSFVRDIETDEDNRAIIRTVVAMGQSLGVRVLVEGVERVSQLALLCEIGCNEVQGFLISVPRPAKQIPSLLEASPYRDLLRACRNGEVQRD
jgi:diguanylate cyclase (GGDEF)-like protein/PAS domain S-box-containing protein